MRTVPKKPVEKIQFYEDHLSPWTTNALAIGTSAADVTALATKTAAAREAYNAQQVAQAAAKAATDAFQQKVAAMNLAGTAIIDQVRVKAKAVGNSVFPLAQIPSPATPAPVGAPGKPSEFKVQLEDDGSLSFAWKCKNPAGSSGTIYQLWRKIGTGEITYLGGAGQKKFTDTTVPAGTSSITYQMQAVRSTAVGPWATFVVTFGVGGSGATVNETEAVKIAA